MLVFNGLLLSLKPCLFSLSACFDNHSEPGITVSLHNQERTTKKWLLQEQVHHQTHSRRLSISSPAKRGQICLGPKATCSSQPVGVKVTCLIHNRTRYIFQILLSRTPEALLSSGTSKGHSFSIPSVAIFS